MSSYWERKTLRRRSILAGGSVAAVGLGGLATVGCGDDDDEEATATASASASAAASVATATGTASASASASASTQATAAAQKRGGVLKIVDRIGSDVFDPGVTIHAGSLYMGVVQVYEHLNHTSTGFKVEPELAELPEQPDQTTLIYRMRPGVKWQNVAPLNGRPFTASDAKFGIERMRQPNPEFTFGSRFSVIDKIEAVDDRTMRITTKEPFAPLVVNIAEDNSLMVAKEAVDKFGDAGMKLFENMIGTGAFLPDRFEQGVRATLKKNPSYWQSGKPYMDGIETDQITDSAQIEAAIVSGQIDINAGWGMSTTIQVAQSLKNQLGDRLTVEPKQLASRQTLHFHTQKKPFDDPRVRRALHLAVDRAVIDTATGMNNQLMGPVPQHLVPYGFTAAELNALPGYRKDKAADLTEAKSLLAAAGVASGLKFNMISVVSPVGDALQQNWKAIGVDVTLQPVPIVEWITARQNSNFDVLFAAITEAADPDQALYGANHTSGSVNFGKFSDPDVDRLATKQRTLFNPTERKAVTDELQKKLLDLSPQVWTFSLTFQSVRRSYVKDFKVVPGYQGWMYADTWLDKA